MPNEIAQIKHVLDNNLGEEVVVTIQLGRNKKKERRGILRETYRSVFVVDLAQEDSALGRVSYAYRDLLTHTIEVSFV